MYTCIESAFFVCLVISVNACTYNKTNKAFYIIIAYITRHSEGSQ